MRRRILSVLCCVALGLSGAYPVTAADTTDADVRDKSAPASDVKSAVIEKFDPSRLPTDELTEAVLLKEIQLERLNEHFRLESTHEGYLRPWRQFMYGEANATLTEAGLIKGMAINWQGIHHPHTFKFFVPVVSHGVHAIKAVSVTQGVHRVSPMTSEQIQEPQLLGQLINASGDVFELGVNCYREMQLRKSGYDSKTYRRHVDKLIIELDALLDQREKFVVDPAMFTPKEIEAMKAEGELLSDMRDLAVINYSEYHASSRRFKFYENAAYVTDFLKNAVGVGGNICQLDGAHSHHPRYTGTGGLGSMLSGVFIIITPIFGRITGNTAGLMARRITTHDFHDCQIHSAEEFIQHKQTMLEHLSVLQDSKLIDLEKRKGIYSLQEDVLLSRAELAKHDAKIAKASTRENISFAAIVGTTKVSLGICNMLAGWRYYNRPATAARLSASGNTSYGAGTAVNIFETARVRAEQELDYQRRRRRGLTRAQVIHTNLNRLDAMEKQLKL